MQDTPILECVFKDGELLQHVDGGFYRFEKLVRSADDLSTLAIYSHVWPFAPGAWARSETDFMARFTSVPEITLAIAKRDGTPSMQAKITSAKAARRAAKT
jgi:hypothetical protein